MGTIFLILIIVSIFGVIGVLRQILNNQKHLDDKTLRNFLLKRLSDKEKRRVTSHLGICEKCQEKLHEFTFGKPIEDHLIDREE